MTVTTQNLYRIVGFERAVQLLQSGELYFAHPSTWDDPYDQGIAHKKSPEIFAQCWCRKAVSDAMWRIYSPNNLGVRIGTTVNRLKAELDASKLRYKIMNIKYKTTQDLRASLVQLEQKRKEKPSFLTTVAPLFLKRIAFDHERETRAVIYKPNDPSGNEQKGVSIKVDANALIRSIWIDPRAPKEYVEAYTHYLKKELKFKGVVKQSTLYAAREHDGE